MEPGVGLQKHRARRKTRQMRPRRFPAVALFTPPGAGWVGGWLGVGRAVGGSHPPRSARSLMGPSVFVYPGENVTRQPGPLIRH